jgi:hypothetical protein
MTIVELFKDWLVPILSITLSFVSVGLALWFSSSAKQDVQKAQSVLDNVNSAIESWQKQIMASTVGILDSMPQVVEGKGSLAKVEAAQSLTKGIQDASIKLLLIPRAALQVIRKKKYL